jgi:predicted AAA+ superfamily ATPase
MINRSIESQVKQFIASKKFKIFFIWGPRRSGKTTLLKKFAKQLGETTFNFDFLSDQELFIADRDVLAKVVNEHKIILIDEVQNFPESTKILKLLHDEFNIKIIATGSSELRQKGQDFDSLAGRYIETFCLPLNSKEIIDHQNSKLSEKPREIKRLVNESIKWGGYPEVFMAKSDEEKASLLENIYNTYVLKDVVSIYDLKDTKLARDILFKIALQIGSEVSLREIANSLQANVGTVSSYLEIFVQNHILIQLPSFKTNLRRSVSENKKYYFLDLGIRNALLKDFRDMELRPDKGNLFENFIISEFYKARKNNNLMLTYYFYREYSGREVDLVLEDYKKQYMTYEIKLTKESNTNNFPIKSEFKLINLENYFEELEKLNGVALS